MKNINGKQTQKIDEMWKKTKLRWILTRPHLISWRKTQKDSLWQEKMNKRFSVSSVIHVKDYNFHEFQQQPNSCFQENNKKNSKRFKLYDKTEWKRLSLWEVSSEENVKELLERKKRFKQWDL